MKELWLPFYREKLNTLRKDRAEQEEDLRVCNVSIVGILYVAIIPLCD